MSQVILDSMAMKRTLGRMAHEIVEEAGGAQDLVVIGILRRGWPLAKRLAFLMAQIEDQPIPHGKLDISQYRDDASKSEDNKTDIPFSVVGRRVILVDEVLQTGRTIRAALDAIMKMGRPESIQLAILVDRGDRQLPIQPDFCGITIDIGSGEKVEVMLTEYSDSDVVYVTSGDKNLQLDL